MASAPQSLPLFYNELVPLSSVDHAGWKGRSLPNLAMLRNTHAIPLTVDEFVAAGRAVPIVFTVGDEPLPIALFGLNEGVNLYLDENDQLQPYAYLPAYVRRYPFMLVRLQPNAEDLSLCFDPTAGLLGDYPDGPPLFNGTELSAELKGTMDFCEQFEMGAARTSQFMKDLKEMDLLMEGEISIQPQGFDQPFVYRGFQMVNEEKLRDLRGDQLRKISQNGMLPLLYAHLFSLSIVPELFDRQMRAGKIPVPNQAA